MGNIYMKILHVEDEMIMQDIVKLYLERNIPDTIVKSAENPLIAMDLLRAKSYDVIISDHYMPRMTGIEFLKYIRAQAEYYNMPCVVFSGTGSVKEEAENLGAQYVCKHDSKSFNLLTDAITNVFDNSLDNQSDLGHRVAVYE